MYRGSTLKELREHSLIKDNKLKENKEENDKKDKKDKKKKKKTERALAPPSLAEMMRANKRTEILIGMEFEP
jgi:hypothetical protein